MGTAAVECFYAALTSSRSIAWSVLLSFVLGSESSSSTGPRENAPVESSLLSCIPSIIIQLMQSARVCARGAFGKRSLSHFRAVLMRLPGIAATYCRQILDLSMLLVSLVLITALCPIAFVMERCVRSPPAKASSPIYNKTPSSLLNKTTTSIANKSASRLKHSHLAARRDAPAAPPPARGLSNASRVPSEVSVTSIVMGIRLGDGQPSPLSAPP